MNALMPLAAAFLQASSFTLDKIALSLKRMTFRSYTGLSFPLSFVITLGIFFVLRPPFETDLLFGWFFVLLASSVALKFFGNLIFYRALDGDNLSEVQIIELLSAIPVVITTGLIFADERKLGVIIPALIASLALVWSHTERYHFKIKKHTLPLLLYGIVMAPVGAAVSKLLLVHWHPVSLELVHGAALTILFFPYFFKSINRIPIKAFRYLMVTNIFTTIAWILFYTSYQQLGVVYTLLLFSVQPILVYLASIFILNERPSWKKNTAFAIVLVSVVTAQFFVSQ